ncbi:ORF6N domain-containing protein [Desulfonatronum thioautotrophicum]|uniref:ORF6N domain-containing protein n=1 Tax=Desulfonatronum thioautotrophicum TaxID=617001 RepID=UPI0005EBBF96|nr:ORF6N domain-containing protein [Desulfonatronum thioautotrophicum]
MSEIIPIENITGMIHHIRGQRVMLDRDLAELYGVETRMLKQAVRRNIDRFPGDFMFELSKQELDNWRSQFVISNLDKMGLRHPPMAFTEQGVAMLSTVLRSKTAIQINIQIMRAFTRIRQLILDSPDLRREIEELRQETDGKFRIVFQTMEQLLAEEARPKNKIGFTAKEKLPGYGK